MNSKALAEVYDIIGFMSLEYQNQIPNKLKEFVKTNRDSFYNTNITGLPKTLDNLQEDTKVFLGIIYEKYFMDTYLDISDKKKEELIKKYNIKDLQSKDEDLIENNNDNALKENENGKTDTLDNEKMEEISNESIITIEKNTILEKIKQLIYKIKCLFKK